jgi:sorbitol-specific phosphotransferase system component IIA
MSVESVEDVAQRLYGLLPEEFTAARDLAVREARAEGDRARATAIGALRRPSLAAWLVNALVRHRPGEVEQLLSLGEALRSAQLDLAGDQVRALGRQRQQLIAAVGRQARALARELGHAVSDDVGQEVEATLGAAMADPAVAEAVRSGRLTSPTSYAGLGTDGDTSAASGGRRLAAVPAPAPAPQAGPRAGDHDEADDAAEEKRRREARRREEERRAAELEQARQEAREAQQAWEDAVANARAAQGRHDEAEGAVAEIRQRIEELQNELQRAEHELAAATRDERSLRRERDAADRVADLAGRAAQRARARVERLDPSRS